MILITVVSNVANKLSVSLRTHLGVKGKMNSLTLVSDGGMPKCHMIHSWFF